MAAKLKEYYTYVDDTGMVHNVKKQIALGSDQRFGYTAYTQGASPYPRGAKQRYILARIAGTQIERKFEIGSLEPVLFQIGGTFVYDGTTFEVISAHGEKRVFPHKIHTSA